MAFFVHLGKVSGIGGVDGPTGATNAGSRFVNVRNAAPRFPVDCSSR